MGWLAAIAAASPALAGPGTVVLVAPGAPVRPSPDAATHAIATRAWAATVVELRGDRVRVAPFAPARPRATRRCGSPTRRA